MTAEIVARLEASFLADDMGEADEELIGILSEIDSLKSRLIRALKRG